MDESINIESKLIQTSLGVQKIYLVTVQRWVDDDSQFTKILTNNEQMFDEIVEVIEKYK